MADTISIDTAPLTGLATDLATTGTRLQDAEFLAAAGAEVARLASGRTPRATGKLAGSLQVRVGTDKGSDAAMVRWGVGYAVYVNFGTRRMRARPFATDALQAAETKVEDLARSWATDVLEGA